jgi:hypothetical protein
MTRRVAIGVVLMMCASALGCGGAPEMAKSAGAAAPSQPMAEMAPGAPPPSPVSGSGSGGGGQSDKDGDGIPDKADLLAANDVAAAKSVPDSPHSAAMLVYTASLGMAVYQVEPGLDGVQKVARDLGGYLSSRQDQSITVRIPRDRFDDAVARIEKLGDVTHRDIKAQDVTDEFVDVQARLKNAYNIRDKLADLLSRAAVKEALDIERELGRVTEEIERMEGRLKLLRDQIAFSTITVNFTALAAQTVHDTTLLAPFPWLQELGLGMLLDVH